MSSVADLCPMPVMKILLKAFQRWRGDVPKEVDRKHERNPIGKTLETLATQLENPFTIQTPVAFDFVLNLTPKDLHDLPEDGRHCPICRGPYHSLKAHEVNKDLEIATVLPCGHMFCDECLAKWLDPLQPENNNSCPMCRAVLFPKLHDICTLDGLQDRWNLIDWSDEYLDDDAPLRQIKLMEDLMEKLLLASLEQAKTELNQVFEEVFRRFRKQGWSKEDFHRPLTPDFPREFQELHLRCSLVDGIEQRLQNQLLMTVMNAEREELRVARELIDALSRTVEELSVSADAAPVGEREVISRQAEAIHLEAGGNTDTENHTESGEDTGVVDEGENAEGQNGNDGGEDDTDIRGLVVIGDDD